MELSTFLYLWFLFLFLFLLFFFCFRKGIRKLWCWEHSILAGFYKCWMLLCILQVVVLIQFYCNIYVTGFARSMVVHFKYTSFIVFRILPGLVFVLIIRWTIKTIWWHCSFLPINLQQLHIILCSLTSPPFLIAIYPMNLCLYFEWIIDPYWVIHLQLWNWFLKKIVEGCLLYIAC